MNFRLWAGSAALALTGALGLTLAGCGGGGSAATTTTRAAGLTGAVQAPQSQTRGASRVAATTTSDPLVPIPGATVTLVNLDDATVANGVVGTTTTNANGSYSFPTVTPGTNYKLEAVKTIGSKTLTLDAVVTAPTPAADGTTAPAVPHDLTPNSTVAAVAVIAQAVALRAADPTSKHANLQSLADDLVKKRVADNTPPPDCTDPAAVSNDASALKQATAPKGSYTGLAITTAIAAGNTNTKLGDTTRLAAQVDASGHFFLAAIDDHTHSNSTTATGTTGTTGTNTGTSGSGNQSGSGSAGTSSGGNDSDNFAVGMVTSDGIVNATTKNGHIKIVGIFNAGVGTGTYQSVDGAESGTWSLTLLTSKYAGLYAGKYVSFDSGTTTGGGTGTGGNTGNGGGTGSGSGNGTGSGGLNLGISGGGVKGDFALLVLDDNTAIISGAGSATSSSVYGTGTVSTAGVLTFTVKDDSGVIATGTGQLDAVAHTVTGTYAVGDVQNGQFSGRSDHADTSDL